MQPLEIDFLTGVEVRFDLDLASSEYFFIADIENEKLKFAIKDMTMFVKEYVVQNELYLKIKEEHQKEPLTYHVNRVHIDDVTLSSGAKVQNVHHANLGKPASKLLIGIQESLANTGSCKCH